MSKNLNFQIHFYQLLEPNNKNYTYILIIGTNTTHNIHTMIIEMKDNWHYIYSVLSIISWELFFVPNKNNQLIETPSLNKIDSKWPLLMTFSSKLTDGICVIQIQNCSGRMRGLSCLCHKPSPPQSWESDPIWSVVI